jgi:hypothetical protein
MTAMVVIPALLGLMYPFLRTTPFTILAGLLLLWAIVSVLRRRELSVRAWVEDIEFVVVGLVMTAGGLLDRPESSVVLLSVACAVQALLVKGLMNGWWGRFEPHAVEQAAQIMRADDGQ